MSRRVQLGRNNWKSGKGGDGSAKWGAGHSPAGGNKKVRPWTACPECADGTFLFNYKIKPHTTCQQCGFLLHQLLPDQARGTDYHVAQAAKQGDADIVSAYIAAKAAGDVDKTKMLAECFPRLALDAPAPVAAEKSPAARYQSVTSKLIAAEKKQSLLFSKAEECAIALHRANEAAQEASTHVAELKKELVAARKAHDEDLVARKLAPQPAVPTALEALRAALAGGAFASSEIAESATLLLQQLEETEERGPAGVKRSRPAESDESERGGMAVDGGAAQEPWCVKPDGTGLLEAAAEEVRLPRPPISTGASSAAAPAAVAPATGGSGDKQNAEEAVRVAAREKLVEHAAKESSRIAAAADGQTL